MQHLNKKSPDLLQKIPLCSYINSDLLTPTLAYEDTGLYKGPSGEKMKNGYYFAEFPEDSNTSVTTAAHTHKDAVATRTMPDKISEGL